MPVQIGDKIPNVTLKIFKSGGLQDIKTRDIFTGKKIILFGVVGAFTPLCAQQHFPDYLKNIHEMRAKGVDEVICMAVNDPFVMHRWAGLSGAENKITMLPDGSAIFTKALGLELDASAAGLGIRCKRFFMIVEKGTIKEMEVSDAATSLDPVAANVCMTRL